jgi:hypothetical protein
MLAAVAILQFVVKIPLTGDFYRYKYTKKNWANSNSKCKKMATNKNCSKGLFIRNRFVWIYAGFQMCVFLVIFAKNTKP